ncbi:MAG: peptidoglycan D,D-transpeptidase FtsI family protein [Mycobacterium leprae]
MTPPSGGVTAPPRPGGDPDSRPAAPARPRPAPRQRVPFAPGPLRLASPARRLRLVLAAVVVVVVAFVARLVQLQALDASTYARAAEKQRLRTIDLPAVRGQITDRNGVPFATSVDARAVYADPVEVNGVEETAARLAPLLGVPAAELRAKLSGTPRRFVYLARARSPEVGRQVTALRLPGIGTEPESRRTYPAGSLAANVVGFIGTDGHGLAGFEHAADQRLAGVDGHKTIEFGRNGPQIPIGVDDERAPVPGATLVLTLDRDIQWMAQRALEDQVVATGAENGTVVVMDPRTGELLALATAPTFDPNAPLRAPADARGNRALSEVYEPGSTNKVITAAAALEGGAVTPETPFVIPPTLTLAGKTFHDAEEHGVEHLTFAGVLAKSSNIGTVLASQRVGKERLYATMRAFGFGDPPGLGLPGESRGILPPPGTWSRTQQYTISFGQGVSMSALHIASVYATIANGGVRVAPTLVRGWVEPEGGFAPAPAAETRRVLGATTARQLRDMLEAVTSDEGTAPAARIPGYRVAGKTGTSQRVDSECRCYRGYTASFVGFAPADKPALLVEVVLQNPKNGHFGGVVAAPVFHDVMTFALKTRAVPPTGTRSPTLPLTVP